MPYPIPPVPTRVGAGEFQGLWPTLIYEPHVKTELVDYAMSSLLFGNYGIDPNIITFNRVVVGSVAPGALAR